MNNTSYRFLPSLDYNTMLNKADLIFFKYFKTQSFIFEVKKKTAQIWVIV